jgi:hypothetical protein
MNRAAGPEHLVPALAGAVHALAKTSLSSYMEYLQYD